MKKLAIVMPVYAAFQKLRRCEIRVPQRDHQTGGVSIRKRERLKAAAKSFRQTVSSAANGFLLHRLVIEILLCILLPLSVISAIYGFRYGLHFMDFQWAPARAILDGKNPYLLSEQNIYIENIPVVANQVPSCLLLLVPYAVFPPATANHLWLLSNFLFTFVFLFHSYKLYTEKLFDNAATSRMYFFMCALLLISGTPWRVLVGIGQHLMFSMAFFTASFYYAMRGKNLVSGILLSLSLFKYTSIFPLCLIFFCKKKFFPVIAAAVFHLVSTVAVAWHLRTSPVDLIAGSFSISNRLLGQGEIDIGSLLYQCGCPAAMMKTGAAIGYVVFTIMILCVLFRKDMGCMLKLCIFSMVSNIMFYHRIYDFVTLFFPLLYALEIYYDKTLKYRKITILLIFCNVMWFFFGIKFLPVGMLRAGICFLISAVLLIFLLLSRHNRTEECAGQSVQ